MLVHICCAVDSHFFLKQLQKDFPNEKIECFFYDPNIHPISEYRLRLLDVQYSCNKLNINLIEGPYDLDSWLKKVKGLELEPEKADRCTVCFDTRLETTILKAKELGHDKFTTTLLISPKKSQEKLSIIGNKLALEHNIQFIFKDYRSGQGMHLQAADVKENSLYRQNYCGCMFGLNMQRDGQNKLCDELISPINNQNLPESIESRLEVYTQRNYNESNNINYKIIKQRFLNYRLISASICVEKVVIPSYFLCYSTLNNQKANGRIEYSKNNIHYLNRDEIKIIDISTFNQLTNSKYNNTQELMYNPLTFENEEKLREKIIHGKYDLSCIIILDIIPNSKIEITCNSKVFEDVKEVLI
ncbi:MAG: epoxyqueuosine reductase QueH [Campylobacteraceae bacterium]|nr:epoxyqueuosine reductase QueH [Campylobacteraceae bacterium]MBT3882679.1 epoxyqueuosine reductase QueH [Campylobacteraceae bacterium]MBT4030488.1 epoxyqueuosine reductase QueH [Campylobacteraceae bacterium]MBT4178970.1 epoxyqueuosine reductase QueH [Campylobacteraceae bacterium]MBT4573031.1 epoxyqueuosine reductase QueH [Campylobacteraceae bacterium]